MQGTIPYTPLEPVVEVLPNGLTVVYEHLPYVHSASIGVWIRTGSAYEIAEWAGVAHFLEHLFFKGTTSRSARELMHAVESKGGQMNAFTSREYTCLYAKTLQSHAPSAVEILADVIKNATLQDMEKERNVILEEIASAQDVPEEYVHDVLTERIWPDHALGRPIMGYEETVARLQFDDVRAYQSAWYQPSNMYVAAVGNLEDDTVPSKIHEMFGDIPARDIDRGPSVPRFGSGIHTVDRSIGQDHVALAFPGVGLADERRFTMEVLSCILGGGSTSRLFERIREEAGLAYAVYTFHSAYAGAGLLGTYAAVAPENLTQTLALMRDEFAKLRDELVSEEELSSNREQLKGNLVIALENTFNRMVRLARSLMFFDRIVPTNEMLDRIEAVTAADVQALAQETLIPDSCALTVLGPTENARIELPV